MGGAQKQLPWLATVGLTAILALTRPAQGADAEALALTRTILVDSDQPVAMAITRRVIAGADTPRMQAIAMHYYVRDEIRFGWAPAFHAQRASEVLASGMGYRNTKSTLFVQRCGRRVCRHVSASTAYALTSSAGCSHPTFARSITPTPRCSWRDAGGASTAISRICL